MTHLRVFRVKNAPINYDFVILQRLLKEHEDNMVRFQDNLRNEQERTKAALKAKLEARRRKRKESDLENPVEAAKKGRVDNEVQERADHVPLVNAPPVVTSLPLTSVPNKNKLSQNSNEVPGPSTNTPPVVTVGLPENMSENDWLSLLITSPVFERVNEIEELLNQGGCVGGKGVLGASRGRAYIDLKDAQWLCTGDLIPVDINDLSPANFVVYRFGVFITQLLKEQMNVPSVTLLLVLSLGLTI